MSTIGLGTWNDPERKNPASNFYSLTASAIKLGYRLIDCAHGYGTEPYVISAIVESGLDRSEFYIISKTYTPPSLDRLLSILQEEKITHYDLFLLHGPPKVAPERFRSTLLTYWRKFNEYVHQGLTTSIGVSNFYPNELRILMELCDEYRLIPPAFNQIEFHPLFQNRDLVDVCRVYNIQVMAHSPLGGLASPIILSHPTIVRIAEELKCLPSQVVLAWELKQEITPIPLSLSVDRLKSNLESSEFVPYLTEDQLIRISELDTGYPLVYISQDYLEYDVMLS